MTPRIASGLLAITIATFLSSCSSGGGVPTSADVPALLAEAAGTKPEPKFGDTDARRAVRMTFRTMLRFDSMHVAAVAQRFSSQQLYSYLLESHSFIGGTFPQSIAVKLREVQQADLEYIAGLESFGDVLNRRLATTDISAEERRVLESEMSKAFMAEHQPVIEAVKEFDKLVGLIAEVYELAAKHPSSFKAMRDGLHIEDQLVLDRYNSLVDRVNSAHAIADTAIQQLKPEQQRRFTRMRVTKPVKA